MSRRNTKHRRAITLAILIVAIPFLCAGQYRAALKVQTFRVLDGLYSISYEQAFNKHISLDFMLQGGHYVNMRPNLVEEYKASGVGAVGSFRYYPFTKKVGAPQGFFGYGALRYITFNEEYRNTSSQAKHNGEGNIINAGLGVGYKFVYRRVGAEAFVGWGTGRIKRAKADPGNNNFPLFFRRSIEEQEHFPQLDVALCYMFEPKRD
jgi:hypothetical protein